MTAWHDQPPVSRRHIRQTERDENVAPEATPEENAAEDTSFAGVARQGWEAEARRASLPQGPPESRTETAIPSGRRVQQPATNERSEPEPLAYITQARPQVPSYDGASFRGRSISAVPQDVVSDGPSNSTPPQDSASEADQPDSRTRDFTPDARRAAFRPVGPPEPSASAGTSTEPVLTRRQMRERGLGGFVTTPDETDEAELAGVASDQASVAEAPVEAVPVPAVPVERPRFRDRARRATVDPAVDREEELASTQWATDPPALVEPPLRPPFAGAIPTEITVAEIVEASPAPAAADSPVELVSTPVNTGDSVVEPDVVVAELEPHTGGASAFEDLLFPSGQPVETATDEIATEPTTADAVPMTFDAFLGGQEAPAPTAPDASNTLVTPELDTPEEDTFVPPVGHWSTQALIDDDVQVQENVFARDVAATSGAITTSALVLPSMPTGEDIMGPLSGTGEILITGSINLPSSMGSTGVHPALYDHSDVDALLEADDREDSVPESAPVRAIRAISTHTASGDVINSMKPQKSSRLPVILITAAAVMAGVVVVLLVAGLIFKIF